MKDIRVLLIDDDESIRRRVRDILGKEGGVEVVGEYLSVEEAILQMMVLCPDIVLIDTQLPGMDWFEATSSLKRNGPDEGVDIIFLADSPDKLVDAFKAGASGYLLKDTEGANFTRAIIQVYSDSHPLKTENTAEEIIELVVLPPVKNILLLNFMYRLSSVINDDFANIVCTVGSWDKGSIITMRTKLTPSFNLEVEITNFTEVEKVEEETLVKDKSPDLARKAEFLPRLGISPDRRLRITLRE